MAVLSSTTQVDVIAIGASAGGIEALHVLVGALPATLGAAVVIVQHLHPGHASVLAYLLGRHAALPVKQARQGDAVLANTVYVAPPAVHFLVAHRHVELTNTKLVHFTRPAIDVLFESVALDYGGRVIGVVLTGSGSDGATGIRAIKGVGGTTMVQDPATASHAAMPRAAHATGCVDHVLALTEIAPALAALVRGRPVAGASSLS